MEEEISRILRLLEEGKIDAAEAERLIRALKELREAEARVEPFGELNAFFRTITRTMRRAAHFQRRCRWWQFFRYLEWLEQARQRRSESLTTPERVHFVLRERVMISQEDISPTARLHNLLPDRIAWETLRYGLQTEFHLAIDPSDLDRLETVQDLEEYITQRLTPSDKPSSPSFEAPPSTDPASHPSKESNSQAIQEA
jgi:acyl carrier protein